MPPEIVVLKVEAPADAKDIGGMDVALLESADGVRGMTRVRVLVETHSQDCKEYNLGLVGRPAYIFGNYERIKNGPVFFRARWLPTQYPIRRRGSPWESYVVDPAYLPAPEKK
ncbi:MAG: hypothetical protein JWM94_505 [Sphingomonas bacterium]|nr:hypothetical protein [Sphingomonas bacterium]